MNIIEIKNNDKLNSFLKTNGVSMLQSWEWGEFQKKMGNDIWRIGIEENGELMMTALIVKMKSVFGRSYLYMSRGPVINSKFKIQNSWQLIANQITMLLGQVKKIADKEGVMFLRIDPEWTESDEVVGVLEDLTAMKAKKEVQPKDTWILNIDLSEDELLKNMHSKARYNIRLAKKKDIKVTRYSEVSEDIFEKFWQVMEKTSERDKFGLHSKDYYKKQLEIFGSKDMMNLFLAELDGNVVSGIIVSFFGDQAVYLHGASDYEYRKYMAPNLLQWEAVLEAKKRGCKTYDFWGIRPENKVLYQAKGVDNWEGISRFKRGFGGKEVNYVGAWDFVYRGMQYRFYNLLSKLR